jgi:hypothetical protein
MRFTTALLGALALLKFFTPSAEAACSWTLPYGDRYYILSCGSDEDNSIVPSIPDDARVADFDGFTGAIPQNLFQNRSLDVVRIVYSKVDIPSKVFEGAIVRDIIIADNVALNLLGDANVFGGVQTNGIFIRDDVMESFPDLLLSNVIGLERLQLQAPYKSISSELFKGLGESLQFLVLGSGSRPTENKVSIPEGLFDELAKLVDLDMRDLNIQQLPQNAFDLLPNLNALSLNLKMADTSKFIAIIRKDSVSVDSAPQSIGYCVIYQSSFESSLKTPKSCSRWQQH